MATSPVASPAMGRELGPMPLSGQMALEWIAVEGDGAGGFVGLYRARGGFDAGDGGESLLAGFHIACRGTMRVADDRIVADEAACRATDAHGNGVWLDLAAVPGGWGWHVLTVRVGQGSGVYARLSGQGEVIRVMHVPSTSAAPWGYLSGRVVWRLD
jgi:hypothetical protein